MLISVLAVTLNIDPDVSWLTPSMKLVSLKLDGLWHLDVPFANCARTRTHLLPRQQLRETRQRSAAVLWGGWCHGYCLWTKAQVWQKVKWTEFGPIRMDGWQAIRGPPRPPQQHYVETQNFSCKCGGVAILKKGLFHFQAIPVWYSLHGLLSTYFQLSMGKRFTLCQFIVSDEILFQAGFDYAAQFGNSAVYIGMDASTDTLFFPKHFHKPISHNDGIMFLASFPRSNKCPHNLYVLTQEPLKADVSITFLRILLQFHAISTISSFHLDNDVPIPTLRPVVFQTSVEFFLFRLTGYYIQKPTNTCLNACISFYVQLGWCCLDLLEQLGAALSYFASWTGSPFTWGRPMYWTGWSSITCQERA